MNVDAGETLGSKSDDDPLWVKKASIMAVAIDYRKAPPRVGKIRPENDRYITSAADDIARLVFAAGIDGKRQMVVGREDPVQKAKHALVDFCVVEKLNLWEI